MSDGGKMDFSDALKCLLAGLKVTREGWNRKGVWLRYVDLYSDDQFRVTEHEPCDGTLLPWIGMKTANNTFVPWLASQTDILADDWIVANDKKA